MYTTSVSNAAAFVDLRSDTVTTPCEEMRKVMMEAEVGHSVSDGRMKVDYRSEMMSMERTRPSTDSSKSE